MERSLPILQGQSEFDEAGRDGEAARKMGDLLKELEPRVRDGVVVAFSGGMDSAFLLWAAHRVRTEQGGRVVALTTVSPSTPSTDRHDATRFTEELEVEHVWRESREIFLPEYARNDRERCYHCKTELFRIAGEVSREMDAPWILYGYTASDHGDDRPGHRAAEEARVLSPLSDVGFTKPEIRHLMEDADLSLASKPASPCLSSRITTGIEVTPRRLEDVEAMEAILREAGVSVLRVRVCRDESGADFLRVEAAPEDMPCVLEVREELLREGLARGYRWVTLDLGGYRTGGGVT